MTNWRRDGPFDDASQERCAGQLIRPVSRAGGEVEHVSRRSMRESA